MLYRFADCLLDTSLHTVQRAGQCLSLSPKVLGVLLYLLEQRQRVVSKDELCAQVWQGLAISAATLESCVRDVRRVLGDRGQMQRIIQTQRGYGYRFVADVTLLPEAIPAPPPYATRDVPPAEPSLQQEEGLVTLSASPPAAPAPERARTERKPVTALCCAVAHASSPGTDLETLHHLMHLLQTVVLEAVQPYGGRLHTVLGDRLLVLFGVSVVREDDARRAVQAALALRQQFQTQQDGCHTQTGGQVALQMGLHTGTVVVAGSQEHGTTPTTVVGEVLDVAMALQEQAAPGEILCSAATARLVHRTVRLARDLPVPWRGQASMLRAHAILGPRTRLVPGRRHAGQRRSPFVGRQREMETLQALWAEVAAGRGQVVGIMGEAGIGKSRLVAELRRSLRQHAVTSLLSHCLSYGSTTPYGPVLHLLREAWGIVAADRPAALSAKVTRHLQALDMQPEAWAPALLSLLGVPEETELLAPLSPEVRKARTLEALSQLCLQGSRQRPLLLAIEDLHWIDASSEEAIAALIEAMAATPVCLVLTYRPGYRPAWLDKSYATQMALQPLSRQDSQHVVEAVLATAPRALPRFAHVLARADGNPFFLEELAQALLEQGPEALAVSVPDTVQAVLRARLDRLPVTARSLLQAAAVIGKDVSLPLWQALTEAPEAVLSQALQQLQAAEFLAASPSRSAPAYTFKHALTQEVTYTSILRTQQQQYHARLAQVLVEQLPETAAQQPEEVARHYTAAGLPAASLPYWQRAGEQAVVRAALVEALSHFAQGLDLLRTLPETPARHQQELTLLLAMEMPIVLLKGFTAPELEPLCERAYALAQQWGDTRQRLGTIWGLGSLYFSQARLDTCRAFVDSVLVLAQQEHDPVFIHMAHLMLGLVCFHSGEFPAAREHFVQSRALYDLQHCGWLASIFGMDTGVMCRARLACTLWMLGDADQAMVLSQEALDLARGSAYRSSLLYALLFATLLQQCARDVRRVHAYADTLLALVHEQDLSFFNSEGRWLRSWALVQQGDVDDGLKQLQEEAQTRVTTQGILGQPYVLACLAEAYGQAGRPEAGLRVVTEALAVVDRHGEQWCAAELYRLQGTLVLQQAQLPTGAPPMGSAACATAAQHFQQARALAQQQQARFWELRAVLSLSRLWHNQGNTLAAYTLLAATYQTFTEGLDSPDLCSARALLDTLRQALGMW